jgi:hypothetical protein
VFATLLADAIVAYDRVSSYDLSEVALDGSQHRAPMGARTQQTEPSPVEVVGAHDRWRILWVPEARFGV